MAKRPGELTEKQERFCLNLFSGMSQREAYIQAGYSSDALPATIDTKASILSSTAKISERLAELRQAAQDETIANVLERKQRLTEIVRENVRNDKGIPIRTYNIQAVAELNKMDGIYDTRTVVNNDNRSINISVRSEESQDLLNGLTKRLEPATEATE